MKYGQKCWKEDIKHYKTLENGTDMAFWPLKYTSKPSCALPDLSLWYSPSFEFFTKPNGKQSDVQVEVMTNIYYIRLLTNFFTALLTAGFCFVTF